MTRWRWFIAGWLRRAACWVMREPWYVADAWHGVPGNRPAELKQRIFQNIVILAPWETHENDTFKETEADLAALAQLAGESWGHIWPKDP
jgi:hypothetical protein